MISFRYHVVSIVAVFLALAIGVVMGTTVIQSEIVDTLEARTRAMTATASALRETVRDQERDIDVWRSFVELTEPLLIEGKLSGRRVVVVSDGGVDASELEEVRTTLLDSGATLSGIVVVGPRMLLPDADTRAGLASALGVADSGSPEALWSEAARALANRLADGPPAEGDDLMRSLIAGEFIAAQPESGTDVEEIGGADEVIVVVAGVAEEAALDPGGFMIPLTESLVEVGQPVAAGESTESGYPFVELLRDRDIDGQIVTVDNLDMTPGQIALVLGLRQMLVSGRGGDYGLEDGATQIPTL